MVRVWQWYNGKISSWVQYGPEENHLINQAFADNPKAEVVLEVQMKKQKRIQKVQCIVNLQQCEQWIKGSKTKQSIRYKYMLEQEPKDVAALKEMSMYQLDEMVDLWLAYQCFLAMGRCCHMSHLSGTTPACSVATFEPYKDVTDMHTIKDLHNDYFFTRYGWCKVESL